MKVVPRIKDSLLFVPERHQGRVILSCPAWFNALYEELVIYRQMYGGERETISLRKRTNVRVSASQWLPLYPFYVLKMLNETSRRTFALRWIQEMQ